jgi:hypothetical protein
MYVVVQPSGAIVFRLTTAGRRETLTLGRYGPLAFRWLGRVRS